VVGAPLSVSSNGKTSASNPEDGRSIRSTGAMRNIVEYPITTKEIVDCLLLLAKELNAEGAVGDMRPLLLKMAAERVMKNATLDR
jgi:hypothetical protein